MSNNIEDQIVSMQFDNKQFESGVATSLGTIDKLKASLSFKGAGQGLDEINRAASGFNLNPMSAAIQGVSKGWLALSTVAVTAIGTITNKAVNAGLEMGKALTVDPIKAGFQNYEQQINATKTILANTASAGTSLKDVEGTLKNLNDYANLTVYNFADMAKNIGTFTAAGVALKPAAESIKGIANLAALSGSSSEQASGAMYQLSQAIAAGQVHLQDWNSVVNAGIGGTVFQRALAQTAVQMGTLDKSAVSLTGKMKNVSINGQAFRNSLTPPPGGTAWLTSKVLTSTLAQFTGDLSKGKLAAEGYSKAQIKAIQNQAKMAVQAATQIKTFSQLTQALKEEVASAWANVFKAIFGNVNQATKFFTPLHNVLQNLFTAPVNGLAAFLEQFRKAKGFVAVWDSFKNIFKAIGNLLYPIVFLFKALTPSTKSSGKGVASLAKGFEKFTEWLVKVTDGMHNLYLPLRRVISIFRIIGGYVQLALDQFKKLSFLGPIISDAFSGVAKQAEQAGSNILAGLYNGIAGNQQQVKQSMIDLGNNIIRWIKDVLGIHSPAATMVPIGLNILQGIVQGLAQGGQILIKGLQKVFIGMGAALKYLVQNINYSDVLDTINSGLFLGLVLLFKRFVKAFEGTIGQFQEIMGKAGGVLDQLTSNLKTMQNKVRSEIIRNIAISVALLAGSALLLSTIDAKKLAQSTGVIAGLMASLVASMSILTKGTGKGTVKDTLKQMATLQSLGKALVAFSSSVLILTGAVALMGQLDTKTIEKGLAGVGGVIAIITASTAVLSKTGGGATILATATAMTIMAVALVEFVGVMKLYEKLDWKTLVRGGGAAALVIAALGLAMKGFGKGAVGGSVGLLIASGALVVLAKALQMLSSIGVGDMIKSVLAISVVLGELAAASELMNPQSAGSLIVMAAAVVVLAKALQIVGKMSLWSIIKAIIGITAAILILAGTAAALSELSPLIAALGTALLLLGGAIFLAGVGVLAFATAAGILAVVGPAAFQAMYDGIKQFLDLLPQIGEAIGQFAVSILIGFVKAAGPLTKALGKLIGILINALTKLIPKIRHFVVVLVNALIDAVARTQGHANRAFLKFVLGLLNTLDKNVPKLIKKGTDLVVAVITGLGNAASRIITATAKTILKFLNGLDKAINKYEPQILHAGRKIAFDVVDGLTGGLLSYGLDQVKKAAQTIADALPGWMKKVLHIGSPSKVMRDEVGRWSAIGVAVGLDQNAHHVEKSSRDLAEKGLAAMKMTFKNSRNAAGNLIDLTPKVTPVLDLSQLEKDATQIGAKMGSPKITADVSRRTARDIASEHAARHGRGHGSEGGGDTYNFNQTNISPEPINHVKAYRGAKSQIALFKEVTGK